MADRMADAALQRLALQELAEQGRVEVVAMPDVEGEVLGRLRRQAARRQACGDEKTVRMSMQIGAVDTRVGVVHELRHRQIVEHRGKGMKITRVARLGGPA